MSAPRYAGARAPAPALVLLAFVGATMTTTARAQEPPATSDAARDRARSLFEQASRARAEARWEDASRLLEESLAIYPQFSTAWNLVTAYEHNDDLVRAERVLLRIRDGEIGNVDDDARTVVLDRLDTIGAELATLVILGPDDADATVALDGEPMGSLDARGRARARVVPGRHVVAIVASDGRRAEVSASVERGATRRVHLALAALPTAAGGVAPSEEDDGSVFASPWFWIATGALLLAGGITAAVLLVDGPTRAPVAADFQIPPL